MRNITQSNSLGSMDQRQLSESRQQHPGVGGGEFSTASVQLDELLKELSREAGFRTRGDSSQQRVTAKRGTITTREPGSRTFFSWEADDRAKTIADPMPDVRRCAGYFSDADVETAKSASSSPKKKVINIEYRPKQRAYSAKVIEKTETRQEYIKEEYLGNKGMQSGKVDGQISGFANIDGRASSIGTMSNDVEGSRYHSSHRMYSSDVEGVRGPPVPPPRRHIASPDPSCASTQIIFQTNPQNQQQDYYSRNVSKSPASFSTANTTRRSRFETTNSQNLSPPLEVKGISSANSYGTYEEQKWLEEQKRKLERSRYSVDRITGSARSGEHIGFRSGSLDIDLDDLVQRNLTNKSMAVHHVSAAAERDTESMPDRDQKGSYYISGIERPAVRTRLPQTKYIFKITSPDGHGGTSATKTQKEVFTAHIEAPPPPIPQPPQQNYEATLKDLEKSLKSMLESSLSEKYKEEEKINKTLTLKSDKLTDEIISLEPIGPGVQLLEPDVGTMRGHTLRSQDGRTSRIDSRSNSLARQPITPRTLSPARLQGHGAISSHPAVALAPPVSYAVYDSFVQQTQQTQPVPTALHHQQGPGTLTHQVGRETYDNVHAAKNFGMFGNQFAQQRHQYQPKPQQQQQALVTHVQPGFFPTPTGAADMGLMGGFKSEEYSSMSYTVSNGPLPASSSISPVPPFTQKALEMAPSAGQRTISIPVAVEERKIEGRHATVSVKQSETSGTHKDYSSTSVSTKGGEGGNLARPVPVVFEGVKSTEGAQEGKANALTAGSNFRGYTFEDKKHESHVVTTETASAAGRISNTGSPETQRSWTVSPSSTSVQAASYSVSRAESQTEKTMADTPVVQVAEGPEKDQGQQVSWTDLEAKLVRETTNAWYKPHITRQEAIWMLRNKPAGSFIVRNSHSFAGGYGLALKVSHLPPNVLAKGDDYESNLVRHFLIESTLRGVKLKGCSNEPIFPSLSALILQHSITPLSLPCKLLLPESEKSKDDSVPSSHASSSDYANNINNNNNNNVVAAGSSSSASNYTAGTLSSNTDTINTVISNNNNNNNNNINSNSNSASATFQEAANVNNYTSSSSSNYNTSTLTDNGFQNGQVLYLDSFNTESLTGPEALWKSINGTLEQNWKTPVVTKIDLRISGHGVVLTDSKHRLFFRRHYPLELISYCATDQSGKIWTLNDEEGRTYSGRVFGFVAKKLGGHVTNQCHLFLELDQQKFSATAVVNLINGFLH